MPGRVVGVTPTRRSVCGALAAAVGLAGCAGRGRLSGDGRQTERTEETLPVDGATGLTVAAAAGETTVVAEDRETLAVRATKRAPEGRLDEFSVAVARDGGRIRVQSRRPDGGRGRIDLDVRVPASLPVERAETAAGPLRVDGVAGDPRVESAAGEVTVTDVPGFVTVETAAGGVTVREVGGVDGITTAAGDVDAEVPAVRDDTALSTAAGRLSVALAADLDARVTAEATLGSVSVDGLPLTDDGDGVSGQLGGGTHRLTVETSAGEIALRRL